MFRIRSHRNVVVQKMQDEIRLDKYNAEREEREESKKASWRRVQLENSWYTLFEKKKAFVDYILKEKEEDQVRSEPRQ